MTWSSYLTGVFFWGFGTGFIFAFAAWLYGRLVAPGARVSANPEPAIVRG